MIQEFIFVKKLDQFNSQSQRLLTIIFELMLRQSEGLAIPFIVKDQSNFYSLTTQAQSFLSQLEAPLTIVTVAGLYRTGKSYLLNRIILNRANGFGVGPTVNPCTKGLWLWAQPIRVSQGKTLLVIDTEGLGALDEESNHDMKIFSLAVLLSTNFIYNSVGSIDQTALQTLSLALHLIGTIDRGNYWSKPNLLWVVRDFSLQLINEHNQSITSSEYLDMALSIENIKETHKMQLRKLIKQSFAQKDCFTLIKPLIDQQKLQILDRVPVEELRPEFVSQTILLRKSIMNSLKEMKLKGSGALNGKEYLLMIRKYLSAINEGQMPNLEDTWTFLKFQKARISMEKVMQNYNQTFMTKLGPRLPMPSHKLTELLSILRKQANEEFVKNCYQQTANIDLLEFLDSRQAQVIKLNSRENKNALSEIIRREFEPFQKKLLSEYYGQLIAYQQDLKQNFTKILLEKYSDRLDIVLIQLQLFAQRRIIEAAKIFERKARQQTTRIRQLKNQAQSTLQSELRNLGRQIQDQRKRYQQELLQNQRKMFSLTSEKQRLSDTLQKVRIQQMVQNEKTKKKAQYNQNIAGNLQNQIQKMNLVITEQEKTIFSLKKQLQKERALSTQKEQYMSSKLQQQEHKIRQIMSQNQKTLKIWELQKRQLITLQDSKHQALIRQNKDISDQLQQVLHQFQHEKFVKKKLEEEFSAAKSRHQEELLAYKQRLNYSNKKQVKKQDDQALIKLKQSMQTAEKLGKQNKQLQQRYKQLSQQLKITKNSCDKEVAIFTQKMQFQQIEINELKTKNNQLNQSYQRYLEHAHNDSHIVQQQYIRKINQLNLEHQARIKHIQEDFEKKYKENKRENSILQNMQNEIQTQMAKLKKKVAERQKQLLQCLKQAQKAYQQVVQKLNNTQSNQTYSNKERETFYQNKIKQLQTEIQNINEKVARQIDQYNRKTQQNLTTLKNYAEQQRLQWEKRIDQQREKNNRKIKQLQEDWTNRLQDQKQTLENIINQLNEKIVAIQEDSNKRLEALRCDYQIRMQKVTNSSIEQRMELTKKLALVQQEAAMNKKSLHSQIEQKTRSYQQALQSFKREMTYDFQQQVKAVRQNLQANEKRNEALKQSLRKAQQSNFVLRSQLDKQKAVGKQKVSNLAQQIRKLEESYKQDTEMVNRAFQEASNIHEMEIKRLNENIDKLDKRLGIVQQQKVRISNEYEQQRSTLISKINYLQGKVKRAKQNQDDLLNKFETTVKSLSNNNNNGCMQKDFNERLQKMKEDYYRKILEKQEAVHQQRKEKDDKLLRLQTQNKSLRDRLLLFEMRQSGKKGRNDDHAEDIERLRDIYERKLQQMRHQLQRYAKQLKQTKEERDQMESMVRMQKSRKSERHSIINETQQGMDTSYNKTLRENKSLLNCRPNPATVNVKKQQNRVMNLEDVTGIMKWNQH